MHTTTASTVERIVCEFERNKDKEMSKEPSTCHQTCSLYNHRRLQLHKKLFLISSSCLVYIYYIFTTHLFRVSYFKGAILHGESAKGNRKWSNK